METITLNKAIGRTRRETLGGREYIVAPLSMLVPGVLNGSRGPLLYPPELVNRNPAVWNHMPIVVYHPMEQGKPTSARDPYILNKQGIGFVFRSKENGRAEGWFDVENTKRVDPRVYDALVKNQPMELSTGLFTKNSKAAPGSNFRGKKYVEIVRDFTPDHLAILPDQKGACSMKDGCGMLINKDGKLTTVKPKSRYRQLIETLQEVINGSANQPRDSQGRWSGGGSGGGASGGKGASKAHGAASSGAGPESHNYQQQMEQHLSKQKEYATKAIEAHKAGDKTLARALAAQSESHASEIHVLKSKIETGDTVKQMQKPGNTTKLANALTKAEGIAKPTKSERRKQLNERRKKDEAEVLAAHPELKNPPPKKYGGANGLPPDAFDFKHSLQNAENLEGSQFGKPHTNQGEPNMAKQRKQVNNEEPVELTEDDREELIDMIVDNCACEEAADRETLNALSDKTLSKLAINAIPPQFMKGKKKVVAEEAESEEEMMDEEEMPMKKKPVRNQANEKSEKKAVTVNKSREETPKLDAKTQFLVNYAERKMQEEKDVLIEKLTANLDDDDKEEYAETLNEEPIEKLEMMVKLLPKEEKLEPVQNTRGTRGRSNLREEEEEQPQQKSRRSFVGAGGALPKSQARQVNNGQRKSKEDDDELSGPLEAPTINYEEIAGFKGGQFMPRDKYAASASN